MLAAQLIREGVMTKFGLLSAIFLSAWFSVASAQESAVSSTYLRSAIFVADRAATVKFFRDVMGYEETGTNDLASAGENDPLGLPMGAKRTLTGMKSKDGAGLSIMGIDHPDFKPLARPTGIGNAGGDVMFVHQVTNIKEIERRAKAGGYKVIRDAAPSPSGKSLQMFLRDPNGVRLELYEVLPEKK
ncbi:MAG: VOC family protein [Rhodospirillaceae bacterium]|nr:VOC family protein [Rhodospirillaceae bacterium]